VSRVGRTPIEIPPEVKVTINQGSVIIEGPKGRLVHSLPPSITVKTEDRTLVIERSGEMKIQRSLHGLTRALLFNMISGVTKGHSKILEINGVGYRAEVQGKSIVLQVGFSHAIIFRPPDGIELSVGPKGVVITIAGIDKQLVGQVAAKIRSFRPPEPYKGKGIRYQGEVVRKKAGKTGA